MLILLLTGLNVTASEMYFGMNYSNATYSDSTDRFNGLNPGILLVKIGLNINEYFAIEGRSGYGVIKDSKPYNYHGNNVDYLSVNIDNI